MYGSQPETQMLQLWSNHRRRTVYTVQPVTTKSQRNNLSRFARSLVIWALLLGLLGLSLAGCVAHYPAYGYARGYERPHYYHGYSRHYGGYGNHHWHGRERRYNDD